MAKHAWSWITRRNGENDKAEELWRDNDRKFSKINERFQSKNPRDSVKLKEKYKENHTKVYNSQTAEKPKM